MHYIGRLSKTQEIKGVIVKTIVKGIVSDRVDMMVKVDNIILVQGLGVQYGDVTERLLEFDIAVENYLSEKDQSKELANTLSKLGFKEEEE